MEARPRSTTATPSERTPSAKAADRLLPDSRMSRPTSMVGLLAKRAAAMPMARNCTSLSWSGTVPRMSYALKTAERDAMAGPSYPGPSRRPFRPGSRWARGWHRLAPGMFILEGARIRLRLSIERGATLGGARTRARSPGPYGSIGPCRLGRPDSRQVTEPDAAFLVRRFCGWPASSPSSPSPSFRLP